ncbi:MAG: hypothetical protein AAF717_02120 [Bacteroidota bacterium]
MEPYKAFLFGCVSTCLLTLLVNLVFKKQPQKADVVIDYLMFSSMAILIGYAISVTKWDPVEKKLSKELKEYRDTQKNFWRRR